LDTITVTFPLGEKFDQDVQQIDLCVKYASGDVSFVVKSWNKNVAAENTEIAAHNSGTALTYVFLNDQTGTALDAAYSVEPYDSVPLTSKTVELAKNRSFMGNNLLGYDTPLLNSLVATPASQSSGALVGNWVDVLYNTVETPLHHYFLDLGTLGFFDVSPQPSPLPYPTSEDYVANLTYVAPGPADWSIYVNAHYTGWTNGLYYPGYTATIDDGPAPTGLIGTRCLKSNSTYRASISFLDSAGRKCGITGQNLVVVPGIDYGHLEYTLGINWSLSNTNALNEIPVWAAYYSINVTKCLTTRFFIQLRGVGVYYYKKNTDGTFDYTATTYAATLAGCAFDISSEDSYSIGYQYNDGDIVRIFLADGTTKAELKITGIDVNKLQTELYNFGTVSSSQIYLFEIYRPYKYSTYEPHYEVAQIFPITNPGTSGRIYSLLSGQIQGDVTILQRWDGTELYLTENMSPLDKFWSQWNTDHGRPNEVDTIGQQLITGNIAYSDVLLQGTKVNGLSSFSALNTQNLDNENGTIQKLQLSNKIAADGTVMLAICEEETVSIYLGEQQLLDTQGDAYVAIASGVIGTFKALKGSMGTSNPESVSEYNGLVFWWDTRNGSAVQYADNGLFALSSKKFVRPASLFSKKFVSLTAGEIEALGSNPFIIGGFDPYHKELLFTIPSTESTPPKGYLTDFPEVVYPYDIYDGIGKTLVYKNPADMWFGSMSFQAEQFIRLDNDLYSFKNGALYIHNQNTANFYGVPFTSKLMFASNPGAIHTFYSIGLESNKNPLWVHLGTEDPYTQSSDLPYPGFADFISKEGVIEVSLLRDRFSPNVTGDYDAKELTGDRLFGKALLTMLEYEFVSDPTKLQLRVCDIGNSIRTGTLINKK
jgi:hypothetical protein